MYYPTIINLVYVKAGVLYIREGDEYFPWHGWAYDPWLWLGRHDHVLLHTCCETYCPL